MGEGYRVSDEVKPLMKYVEHHLKKGNLTRIKPFFKWFQSKVSSIECNGLQELCEERNRLPENKRPVYIHVGRHLSELDWSETQYQFHAHNNPIVVSMGHNLDVWPVGNLLKSWGGFVALREACTLGEKEVSKKLANTIYNQYFHHVVINEGMDVLVYPEQTKTRVAGKMTRKYGRSYSGELLEFASHLFRLFQGIQRKTERPIMVVPHSISRERVAEDQIFKTLTEMKENGWGKSAVFAMDMGFVYTHWLYQRKGKVAINFGEPVHVNDFETKKLAQHMRAEVAGMSVLFPTHIFAYAIGENETMLAEELERRVASTISSMDEIGLEVDCRSPSRTVKRAVAQFNQPRRRIVKSTNGYLIVQRPEVVAQYRNNVVSLEDAVKNSGVRTNQVRRISNIRGRAKPERRPTNLITLSGG